MSRAELPAPTILRVDRVACSGHGICAQVMPGAIRLDEWGYPIFTGAPTVSGEEAIAIKLCPARALYRPDRPAG